MAVGGGGSRHEHTNEGAVDHVGDRYDETPVQVALRGLVQGAGVVAVPDASSRRHLAKNLAVFDFALDDELARVHDR